MWQIALMLAAGAVASAAGSGAQARGNVKNSNKQLAAKKEAQGKILEQAMGGDFMGEYGLDDIFGTKVDYPIYEPIDLTESLMRTLDGNLQATPKAAELAKLASEANLDIDLSRIRKLYPTYDETMGNIGRNISSLTAGQLPFEDAMDVVSNRGELSTRLGMGGTGMQRNATLKDLGMSRVGAMQQGQSMFAQIMQTADQNISPLERNPTVQSGWLSPSQRLDADITQNKYKFDSMGQAAVYDAMADPSASNMFGYAFSEAGQQPMQQPSMAPYLMSGVGQGLSAAGGMMAANYIYGGAGQAQRPQVAAPTYSTPYVSPQVNYQPRINSNAGMTMYDPIGYPFDDQGNYLGT